MALVYASDDEFFEPEWERFMARELLGIEPIEIPGGHFPMAEDPEGLADLLETSWPADRFAHPSSAAASATGSVTGARHANRSHT